MAKWTISEYSYVPSIGGRPVLGNPHATAKLTAGGSHNCNPRSLFARICGDTACHVKVGAGATTNDPYLPANTELLIELAGAATISLTSDATAPTMTSAASANNEEGVALAFELTASEAGCTFAITGGVDAAQFAIADDTLTWVGDGVQDFADPQDADTNNTYVVEVTPTDAALNVGTPQTITITVTEAA